MALATQMFRHRVSFSPCRVRYSALDRREGRQKPNQSLARLEDVANESLTVFRVVVKDSKILQFAHRAVAINASPEFFRLTEPVTQDQQFCLRDLNRQALCEMHAPFCVSERSPRTA
jgi:hypothetical protein